MVSATSHTYKLYHDIYTYGKCILILYTSLEYCTDGHKKRGGSNVGGIEATSFPLAPIDVSTEDNLAYGVSGPLSAVGVATEDNQAYGVSGPLSAVGVATEDNVAYGVCGPRRKGT